MPETDQVTDTGDDLGLPTDMSRSIKRLLRVDYLRFGQCRYEDHGNGYRRLSPMPPGERR